MSDLIYCGTEKVSAANTQALLAGSLAAIWSPPMWRRVTPTEGDRLWLLWRKTAASAPLLLGAGRVICPSPNTCDWTNSTAPGIVDAARGLGYGGPTNMAFLRLCDVEVFTSLPIVVGLGDLPVGLSSASANHVEALARVSGEGSAPVVDAGQPTGSTSGPPRSHPLFDLLRDLHRASVRYTLARDRDDTIRVNAMVGDDRVEVDVFEDGHMDVAVLQLDVRGDATLIKKLLADAGQSRRMKRQARADDPLPYDMGNAGDLLKHGLLAEFTQWWCRHEAGPLRFLDPFAGRPWISPPVSEVTRRLLALPGCALRAAQPHPEDRYYGSSYVVLNAASAEHCVAEVSVSDSNPSACAAFQEGPFRFVSFPGFVPSDGLSILEAVNRTGFIGGLIPREDGAHGTTQ